MLRSNLRRSLYRPCELEVVFLDVHCLSKYTTDEKLISNSNVPVGVLACILIMLFFTFKPFGNVDRLLPFKKKLSNLDVLGATNLVAAVCCLLLALQWGGTTMPWRAPTIIGLFVGFVFLSITFGFLQWRFGEKATIPLRILRQQSVLMGSWYIFFFHMSNFVVQLLLSHATPPLE